MSRKVLFCQCVALLVERYLLNVSFTVASLLLLLKVAFTAVTISVRRKPKKCSVSWHTRVPFALNIIAINTHENPVETVVTAPVPAPVSPMVVRSD